MALLSAVNRIFFGSAFVLLLCTVGAVLWGRLRFFPLLHPRKTLRALGGGGENFRSLTLALAGTLGVGNIVGVSAAIHYGGAGALFWMWISAFCMMPVKYAEIYLSVRLREKRDDGWHGGPMYYMPHAFRNNRVGKSAAIFFAVLCLFASFFLGNLIQIRAAASGAAQLFDLPAFLTAALMLSAALFLIFCDREKLTAFTSFAIPVLCVGYLALCIWVLLCCRERLPQVLRQIFADAFSFRAAAGGVGGTLFFAALRQGCAKGVFSHEGGCGTAPISYAGAPGADPVKTGVWGMLEIFVDTVLLCTLTGLVLLVTPKQTGAWGSFSQVAEAFGSVCGVWGERFIGAAVIVFAFSTLVCWSFYGAECIRWFTPAKGTLTGYRLLFCLAVIPGVYAEERFVWEMNDFCTMAMTALNVLVVLKLFGRVRTETKSYFH